MTAAFSEKDIIVIRPARVPLPAFSGQLDLDGLHNTTALCRPQMPQRFGHVPPALMAPFFTPCAMHHQIKLADDDRIVLSGLLCAFAPSLQQTANYLFSRNPQSYLDSELCTFTIMSDLRAGDSGHVPPAHIDAQLYNYLAGISKARTNCVYATEVPTWHYPELNPRLADLLKDPDIIESEDGTKAFVRAIDRLTQGTAPLCFDPGDIVAHSDYSIHRSGRAEVAARRIFQSAILRPDNDCREEDRAALRIRMRLAGLS